MIIDTHVHFYDPERPQGVPWPPADNALLYRTVLPEHCKTLAVPEGVTGVIVVEASPWVEDNQWILDLAEDEPFIVGFVGDLYPEESDDFEKNLDRFAANPLFRGIRIGGGGDVRKIKTDAIASKLHKLAERDLELDLLTNPDELPEISALAARIPDLRIVIDHVAYVPIDGKAPNAKWAKDMRAVAKHPHVYCKVSGIVERTRKQPAPDDLAYYVPTLDALWEIFGEDRVIYGSNWPVCERAAGYSTVFRIVSEYVKGRGEEASEKYFWKNAKTVYKWIERW